MIRKKISQKLFNQKKGQALVPILIIILTIITLGVGTLYISIGGLLLSSYSASGETVLMAAEGALENGLLRILRSPNYSGESLQVNGLDCTITVNGLSPQVVSAQCVSDLVIRKLQAEVTFINGEMIVDHHQEVE